MTIATGTQATIDLREAEERRPVWEKTITFAIVTADTAGTISLPIDGVLRKIIYARPDTSNNDLTSTLTIADNGDNEIFTTSSGLAENATSVFDVNEPLLGTCDVTITLNEAAGASSTFTVTLRGV